MSQKKALIGKPFQKGVSGNPNGRPKLPPEVLEARKYTRSQVELSLSRLLGKTREELQSISRDPLASALDLTVVSILSKAIQQGDSHRLDFLLNRIIGPVKAEIDLTVHPKPTIIERFDGKGEVELGVENSDE